MFVNITIFVGSVEAQCRGGVKFLHRYIRRKSWSLPRQSVSLMKATPESVKGLFYYIVQIVCIWIPKADFIQAIVIQVSDMAHWRFA